MPGDWHDSTKKLFEADDALPADILRDLMGVNLAREMKLTLFPQVISDKPPVDLVPDLLFLAGPAGQPTRMVIVEVQKETSRDKRRQWPRYVTALWARYTCPVDLLVICPDEATALWCAEPIRTNLEDFTCRPRPLLPSRVPALTSAADIAEHPGLGVLSVAYHGTDPAVADAFVEGTGGSGPLGPENGKKYYDFGYTLSAPDVQQLLEELMNKTYNEIHSPTLRKQYAEGWQAGEEQGLEQGQVRSGRKTVLMVARARRLELSDEQRELVESSEDLPTLTLWGERAVTAKTADDIFR